jgi:large-conductance mechanosensitive channel
MKIKIPQSVTKLVSNKYVFYVALVISIIVNLGYLKRRNYVAVIIFLISGALLLKFSKNLTGALIGSIIISNVFLTVKKYEGFETAEKDVTEKEPTDPEVKDTADIKNKIMDKLNKKLEGVQKDVVPDNAQAKIKVDSFKNRKGSDIDYASTIQDAYSQLNGLIGSEGVKGLTTDTQKLMEQQLKLAKSMESMGPLIEGITPLLAKTKSLLGGFDDETLNKFTSFAKGFT